MAIERSLSLAEALCPRPPALACRACVHAHRPWHAQVLASAEQRERRIVAAEEVLVRRRKELEREHGARMGEAEAAVRRLQVRAAGTGRQTRVGVLGGQGCDRSG